MAHLKETILRFGEQFSWEPTIEREENLPVSRFATIYGMGGSHLSAWALRDYAGVSNIHIHRDYGISTNPNSFAPDAIHILSSYSGTTEEVLDSGAALAERRAPLAAISKGGTLSDFAEDTDIPYIKIPESNLEPRMAIGYSLLGLARLLKNEKAFNAVKDAGRAVVAAEGEDLGATIAEKLKDKVPVVWTSLSNSLIGYLWKIKFNETAKIPSFANVFPELCHNEFTGFDVYDKTRAISCDLAVVMIHDESDHERNKKRMHIAKEMLDAKGIPVVEVSAEGAGLQKMFSQALLADWVTLYLAENYKVPNPETPLVAEFKQRMAA